MISGRNNAARRDDQYHGWGRDEIAHLPAIPRWAQTRPLDQALSARAARERAVWRAMSPALAGWLVVYALLNVGDLVSTYLGLAAGLHEANPLMSGLLTRFGFGALIAYKLVVIVAVVAGAMALFRMHPRAAYLTVHVCNVLVFAAVALNVLQMFIR
jgi:hypothetical protein